MPPMFRVSIFLIIIGTSLTAVLAQASHRLPSDTQLRACRDKLAYHSKFSKLPMAAFSVSSGTHKHSNVDWSVKWDGRHASGTCKVGEGGGIESFNIRRDSRDGKHQSHNQSGSQTMGDFYYDRHVNKWRDPDGRVCHTCTPENGFPNHGQKDQQWKPKNHLEREMSRHLNRTLTEQDLKNLRQLQR